MSTEEKNVLKNDLFSMLKNYKQRAKTRKKEYDLPPRPLTKEEVELIFSGLTIKGLGEETFTIFCQEYVDDLLIRLLSEEVRRGTFPASYAKAAGLASIVSEQLDSPYLRQEKALQLLADMKGGAATGELISLLEKGFFQKEIITILEDTVLVNQQEFDKLTEMAEQIPEVQDLLINWAERCFSTDWKLADRYKGLTMKVGDNITTGHLSPSKYADSRTDQPRHALHIMEGRKDEEDFLDRLADLKQEADNIFLTAGEALGEGSSRKSATYTLLQVLGKPVPGEPEIKEGGVVIAKSMAPIFKKSLIASGIIPVIAETDEIKEGDKLELNPSESSLLINNDFAIEVELPGEYALRKIAAGGMKYFDAGNELQKWAVEYCRHKGLDFDESRLPDFTTENEGDKKPSQTLAQKIVGLNRLDGKDTILPGETAEIKVRGVFTQDTTGPMTNDEYQAMAGGDFGADFVIQSLCHTGECPSSEERDRHQELDQFATERGGVCLEPGEGIIHTIGNRFVLPTDVIVGGDSHTRTPQGVSFPAASDIVAGAMKYGKQSLTMDESVKVVFSGNPNKGITARDLVSTLVIYAEKTCGKEVYNGRIIEMEGLEFLDGDERYILTNAVAERSASAGTIPADEKTIATIKDNLEYLKSRPDAESSPSVINTINAIEEFLSDPRLPRADQGAEYEAVVEIPLEEVSEPLVAKPHHPDNVAYLSEVAGTELDEIYIGSCVGGDLVGIRDAARMLEGKKVPHEVNFVVCPASRDIYQKLSEDGSLAALTAAGATIIMPGCGLCMGNKRRIGSGAVALTTTTRNYQSRIGPTDSRTYLGSAHVAAAAAVQGRIPELEEYFALYEKTE
ncbi:MAG: aconitase family protein [Bacillota bacterium]